MTPKSKSMRCAQQSPRSALLHVLDHTRLVLLELRLDLLLDGTRPCQERRLALVDRHADGRSLLFAVLAVVLLRQRGELLQLATHRYPRHAVDRRRVRALRHHFLHWRGPRTGDAAKLRLRKALLHPAFLASAGVISDRDIRLVELVDA